MSDRWWTDLKPDPRRGIIPRKVNPYKGNTVNRKINPLTWKILEMNQIRNMIRDEVLNIKQRYPKRWKRIVENSIEQETTMSSVAGVQEPGERSEHITALKELKGLYEKLDSYIFDDISRASSFASKLSEYLVDEGNFELRNFHGQETVKRNAKHLNTLSDELQKATDSMNTSRRQALAIVDEIGMIAYRYDKKG